MACWLTWPLARWATTALPYTAVGCVTDLLLLAWALAHQSRSLAGHVGSWFHGGIFHPTPHALLYGEAAFGAVPIFAPIFLATGRPALALNAVFLGGIAMTAAALHVVVRRWTGLHSAGIVAAITFLASPWIVWSWGPVAPNYVVLFYLPAIVFLLAEPATGTGRALLLATLTVLQGLCSVYLAVATLVPLGAIGVLRLLRPSTRAAGITAVTATLAAGGILAVPFATHLLVRWENPDLALQSPFPNIRGGIMALPSGLFAVDAPAFVPLAAWVVIALGAASRVVLRRPASLEVPASPWRTVVAWTGVALFASLTPVVAWRDGWFTLPHARLLQALGFYQMLREPRRLGVAALIGLAMLAGLAFATLARRGPWGRGRGAPALRALAVVVFVVATRLSPDVRYLPGDYPSQTTITDAPWLDAALARHPGPLLETPVGTGAGRHARAMYRAIYHRQPVLNGYSGYWPAEFPGRMAVACRVPDVDAIRELRRTTGLATILVLVDRAGAPDWKGRVPYDCEAWDAERWRTLAAKGGEGPLRLVAREGEMLLFAVGDD
jgi:hypothetical protein